MKYYIKAIELDPTLWVAFEKVCKLAPQIKPETLFRDDHPIIAMFNSVINSKEYFNKTGGALNVHSGQDAGQKQDLSCNSLN